MKNTHRSTFTPPVKINTLLKAALAVSLMISAPAMAAPKDCFNETSFQPSLIALTAKSGSDLATWYKDLFDLQIVKEFEMPANRGGGTGILMENNGFVVEIFFRNDAVNRKEISPETGADQWMGYQKYGVVTYGEDLPELKQCLNASGVQAGRIFKDELLRIDLLLVTDPDGNIFEIISSDGAGSAEAAVDAVQ